MIAYRAIGVALAVSLLISGPGALAFAADFLGQVVRILDGDTLEVLHNQAPERIGLSGIDCPEKGQLFGKRAKQAASELVFGMEVTLQTHGHDKYGRSLADVLLSDGTNGCCTAPRRSSFQSATYEEGSSFIALIRYRMRSDPPLIS